MKRIFYSLFVLILFTGFTFGGVITVTSPACGSEWCINDNTHPVEIRWNESPKENQLVKIRLYDSTATNQILKITDSTDNNGVYNWTIPPSIPAGQYIIRVRSINNLASGDSAVFTIKECSEIEPIRVGPINADHMTAIFPPDLKVSLIPMPEHPEIYQNSFVRFKVENVGKGLSKETILRAFRKNPFTFPLHQKWPEFKKKFIVDEWEVHSLNPGRSFSRDIKFNPQMASPIYWEADVDHENNIGDKNRGNNRAKLKLKVKGPDLTITKIYSPDYKKTIQQKCKIEVTVKNIGPVKAGKFEIDCDWHSSSGSAQGRKYRVCEQGLNPGQSMTFKFDHRYAGFGNKYPDLFVDKTNMVREQNEGNNKCGFVFHVSIENISGSDAPKTITDCK